MNQVSKHLISTLLFVILTNSLLAPNSWSQFDFLKRNKDQTEVLKEVNQLLHEADSLQNKDFSRSLRNYKKCARLLKNQNLKEEEANVLMKLGKSYLRDKDYKKANQTFLELLEISNQSNREELAEIYMATGNSFSQLNKGQEAINFFTQALSIYDQLNLEEKKASTMLSIGNTYYSLGQFNESKEYLLKASQIYGDEKEERKQLLHSMGQTYDGMGDFKNAIQTFKESLLLYEEENNPKGIASTCVSLAVIYLNLKKYKEAEELFLRAEDIAKSLNDKSIIQECYAGLSQIASKKGSYKSAYELYQNYILIKDSIAEEDRNRELSELKRKWEMDVQRIEIDLLKQDSALQKSELERKKLFTKSAFIISILLIVILIGLYFLYNTHKKANQLLEEKNNRLQQKTLQIIKSERKLIQRNQTKDKFFSIIAHDLKGPMSTLKGFLTLLHVHGAELSKEELELLTKDMSNSVNNVSSLLENLLKWAFSQDGEIQLTAEEFDISELIENNYKLYLDNAKEKGIALNNLVPNEKIIVLADKDMIDFSIRNLIQNALKFTKENGKIDIVCENGESYFSFKVKDTGIGIPENQKDKIFTGLNSAQRKGTKNEKGTGLGLILVKEFIDRHHGAVGFESQEAIGSTFFFTIPKFPITNA